MNITLNADDDLLAKARAYAQARDTTLNQLLRRYLARVTGHLAPEAAAAEFADLARRRSGRSDTNILAAAERAQCSVLLSEDLDPQQLYATVRVENPLASSTTQ